MNNLITTLVVIGVLLLCLEFFVPGIVIGLCGTLSIITAVTLCYLNVGIDAGNRLLTGVLIGVICLMFFWLQFLPTGLRRWTLKTTIKAPTEKPNFSSLCGVNGKAITHLRPAGTADLSGRRVDVVAESDFIEAGTPVIVTQVEGMRVVVRARVVS